ncbi:unnamed protein product [Ixodes hexagonus]
MPRRAAVVDETDSAEQSSSDNDDTDWEDNLDEPTSRRSVEFPPVDAEVIGHIEFAGKPPKTIAMICEAVTFLDDKKGSTPRSIVSWILSKYNELDGQRFKAHFRRAYLKGIEDGVLVRTNSSKDRGGLTGRVKLAPVKPKTAQKAREPATKKTRKAPTKKLEAGDDSEGPSVPAAPKPPAKPKALKKVKKPNPEDLQNEEEVEPPKAPKPPPPAKPRSPKKAREPSPQGAQNAEEAAPEVSKPSAKPKAPRKVKEESPQGAQDVEEAEVGAPKAKAGRLRRIPADKEEGGDDHPPEKAKARPARKKATPADPEPAPQPEDSDSESDREEPKKRAAAKGRQQPARLRKNAH